MCEKTYENHPIRIPKNQFFWSELGMDIFRNDFTRLHFHPRFYCKNDFLQSIQLYNTIELIANESKVKTYRFMGDVLKNMVLLQ